MRRPGVPASARKHLEKCLARCLILRKRRHRPKCRQGNDEEKFHGKPRFHMASKFSSSFALLMAVSRDPQRHVLSSILDRKSPQATISRSRDRPWPSADPRGWNLQADQVSSPERTARKHSGAAWLPPAGTVADTHSRRERSCPAESHREKYPAERPRAVVSRSQEYSRGSSELHPLRLWRALHPIMENQSETHRASGASVHCTRGEELSGTPQVY